MKTKRFILANLLICLLSIGACSDNFDPPSSIEQEEEKKENELYKKDPNLFLKEEFGKALVKVLGESKEIRELIKEEALKKINHDYDVLYLMIKDKKVGEGRTLNQLLEKHINPFYLEEIKQQIPTLTIFVPKLPEESFSAELWDTENEIPMVGIRTKATNDVPIFEYTGEHWTLDGEYIPAFPIIVIKENERITINSMATKGNSSLNTGNEIELSFIDETFNNYNIESTRATPELPYTGGTTAADPRMIKGFSKVPEAYDTYNNFDGWQRDYIYYNISPKTTEGPFNHRFQEYIVGFELLGNWKTTLNKISDQAGDPQFNEPEGSRTSSTSPPLWTDGEFEFKVKVHHGNVNGIGNEYVTYFRCDPTELFKATYTSVGGGGRGTTAKKFEKLEFIKADIHVPLFQWNLETYSPTIKISIEEVDATETIKSTTQSSTEFASNFEFSVNWGTTVKKGLKFGDSQKRTEIVSYEYSTTAGNDELGEVLINFSDPIITGYTVKDSGPSRVGYSKVYYLDANFVENYKTGFYRIYITPLQNY